MTSETRGAKRHCAHCGTRFYDLGKNPAHCPKCNTVNDLNAQAKTRRRVKAVIQVDEDEPLLKTKKEAKKPVKEIEDIDLEEFEDIETLDADADIGELEEIEDIDAIEELEEIEEPPQDDEALAEEDITLEEEHVGDEGLIDDIDEMEDSDAEAEDDEPPPAPKPTKRKSK